MKIGKIIYECLMLNDDIPYNQGLTQKIFIKTSDDATTDFLKREKIDDRINKEYIIVNKQTQEIEELSRKANILGDIFCIKKK